LEICINIYNGLQVKYYLVQDKWIFLICQLRLSYNSENDILKEGLRFAQCLGECQASKRESVCVNNLCRPVWGRQRFNQEDFVSEWHSQHWVSLWSKKSLICLFKFAIFVLIVPLLLLLLLSSSSSFLCRYLHPKFSLR